MKDPLIFDIKRCSTVDGPGIRTALFFKGCNLNCYWCHNPEGKAPEVRLAFFAEKCISCGACKKHCQFPTKCTKCVDCTRFCPTHARKMYGKQYSITTLTEIVLADKPYYDATGGGVTVSGGECLLYPNFVASLAKKWQEMGISVAIDTAGSVPYAHFEAVLPYTSLFLYDIKCLDSALHKKGTGCDNKLILQNLERLIATGKEIRVRIPVIPDFNAGDEVERVKHYCVQRDLPYELLPYHAMGESKRQAMQDFSVLY